ncbi:MAG: hypothetical protein HY726_07345 [Candidatus Rokubacteria bacterium]|nr:hypothetical protein [Candidatus Rokubacteria bacterium]
MWRSQNGALRAGSGRRLGLLVGLGYVLAYLYSVQNIVVVPGVDLVAGAPVPSVAVAADWSAKIWKPIAPFVWEPVVAVYPLRSVAVFLSVPNLLVALSLAALVGLNVSVALARVRAARAKRGQAGTMKGLLASTPALLTGFTCCVPTAVLALGSLAAGLTVAVIAVRPYFVPAAALALTANLLWSRRRLRCQVGDALATSGPVFTEAENR